MRLNRGEKNISSSFNWHRYLLGNQATHCIATMAIELNSPQPMSQLQQQYYPNAIQDYEQQAASAEY